MNSPQALIKKPQDTNEPASPRRTARAVADGVRIALLVVALLLLGSAAYLLPAYGIVLLPLAVLPVALAALLHGRRVVYLSGILALLVLAIGNYAAERFPPAWRLVVPEPPAYAPHLAAAATVVLLVLLLAPISNALRTTRRQSDEWRREREALNQSIDLARHERDSARARISEIERAIEALIEQSAHGALQVDQHDRIVASSQGASARWEDAVGGRLDGQTLQEAQQQLQHDTTMAPLAIEPIGGVARHGTRYTHLLHDRRELVRLQRLRGELLSLLAHEMRDPLTSMLTALEMTLGQDLPPGSDRVLSGARRSSQRLLELVTTLIEINQFEAGVDTLRRTASTIRPIIESAIAYSLPMAQQGGVQITVEYLGDALVQLDIDRMRRAFSYVLEYAVRLSPTYSTVNVQTIRDNGAVILRISDQGPGLNAEQPLSPFDQLRAADDRDPPMLGMTFSRLVVEAHGGRVAAESNPSNQGVIYTLMLPVSEPSDARGP